MRYLGVVFDKQLSYTEHVNTTLQRATKGVNALKAAAGRRAEERHLVTLYKALVLSIIDFALPMIQMSQNQVNHIERLQNACLRIITGCTRSTPILLDRGHQHPGQTTPSPSHSDNQSHATTPSWTSLPHREI